MKWKCKCKCEPKKIIFFPVQLREIMKKKCTNAETAMRSCPNATPPFPSITGQLPANLDSWQRFSGLFCELLSGCPYAAFYLSDI